MKQEFAIRGPDNIKPDAAARSLNHALFTQSDNDHQHRKGGALTGLYNVLQSPGEPLDSVTRQFFEKGIGHDLSAIRVHTDVKAAESARALNARAYTVGHDIVFGEGRYHPATTEGRRVLAHEIVHTVQQSLSQPHSAPRLEDGGHPHEAEARDNANRLCNSVPASPVRHSLSYPSVQRDIEIAGLEEAPPNSMDLPRVSTLAIDPRLDTNYFDRRVEAVGFGIYLGGIIIFCDGLPIFVPSRYVNEKPLIGDRPVSSLIHEHSEGALASIPAGPLAPSKDVVFAPYAYYRGPKSLIFPTSFSPTTAPRTIALLQDAKVRLASDVQRELTVIAISLMGMLLLQAVVRVGAKVAEMINRRYGASISRQLERLPRHPDVGRKMTQEASPEPLRAATGTSALDEILDNIAMQGQKHASKAGQLPESPIAPGSKLARAHECREIADKFNIDERIKVIMKNGPTNSVGPDGVKDRVVCGTIFLERQKGGGYIEHVLRHLSQEPPSGGQLTTYRAGDVFYQPPNWPKGQAIKTTAASPPKGMELPQNVKLTPKNEGKVILRPHTSEGIGHAGSRGGDAEVMSFEDVLKISTPETEGVVFMGTQYRGGDWPTCVSCTTVITEFNALRPKIDVVIMTKPIPVPSGSDINFTVLTRPGFTFEDLK